MSNCKELDIDELATALLDDWGAIAKLIRSEIELRARLSTAEARVADLEESENDLANRAMSAEARVKELEERVKELEERVEDIDVDDLFKAGAESERAAVVAWLRKQLHPAADRFASRIESAAHITERSTDGSE